MDTPPGVVTAVALVLPVTDRHLLQSYRQGLLSRRELSHCRLAGLTLVVLGVPIGLVSADRLARLVDGEGEAVP